MKIKKILKILNSDNRYRGDTITEHKDYIYLYSSHSAILYDDRFQLTLYIHKDKVIVDLKSVEVIQYRDMSSREIERTLKKTYLYTKKEELKLILEILTNSTIIKGYREGNSFREIPSLRHLSSTYVF